MRWIGLAGIGLGLVALACGARTGRLRGLAIGATPPASAAAAEPLAGSPRSDLVTVDGGLYRIDHFDVCEPADANAPGPAASWGSAPASSGAEPAAGRIQLLVHSEARVDEISRDRFVAATTRAALRRVEELADEGEEGWRESPLVCREIVAPEGDVDYEIDVRVSAAGAEVRVVDVARRDLALPASARPAGGRCQPDGMGVTYCAVAGEGTAVKTNLGQVVCARGACVRPAIGDWSCSRASGGWAELDEDGRPQCERGCYTPSTTQCRAVR